MHTNKLLILLSALVACNTMAAVANEASQQPGKIWVGTLSGGPAWENGGVTQTFYLAPGIEKTYAANLSTHAFFDGEIFLGLEKTLTPTVKSHLGVALGLSSNTNLTGNVWDDANPYFNNNNYSYKLQHSYASAKAKLFFDLGYRWVPWLSASLGFGFNNAHSFNNNPTIPEAIATPNFTSYTEATFTYALGTGLETSLNQHWQIGLGYEFSDWGRSHLGRGALQSLNSGLTLAHLFTNTILGNLTYRLGPSK